MKKLKKCVENFRQRNLKHRYQKAMINEACPNLSLIENTAIANASMQIRSPRHIILTTINDFNHVSSKEVLVKELTASAALEKQWKDEDAKGMEFTYTRDRSGKILRTKIETDK